MKKRVFAVFLVLSMAAALLPLSVMAEESGEIPAEQCTCDAAGHKWVNGVCQCASCGKVCDHLTEDGTTAWEDGRCAVCTMVCDHSGSTAQPSCEDGDGAICTVCGGTIYSTGHAWQAGQCKNCTATHDHAQEDWADGVCGVCGKVCAHETFTDDGVPVSAWENGVCTVCGKQQEPEPEPTPTPVPTAAPHWHYYTSRVTTAAGCVTPGVRTYTCSCGASYTEAIPATGHDWDEGKVELASGDNSLRVDIACVCKNCGATQSMQHDSVEASLTNRARDNQVTVVSDMPETVEVKGTVLPNGGTAYVIRETVAADGEAAQSISLKSESEDIRYVGYQRTDEKGVATETLELNAAKGLASVDILRGELENGTPTIIVKENGERIDLSDVTAALDGEQLSYSITTENGSEWGYSTGSTVKDMEAAQTFFDELLTRKNKDGLLVDPVVITTEESQGHFILAGCIRGDSQSNHEEDSDVAALESEVESLLEEMSSVRDGGWIYLETSDGGVLVPSGSQTGEGNNEDTLLEPTATPAPSATPTPTPTPEATEDVWVTISFETKTLYEDDTTIATVEDDSPTIVRFVDTTPTPAPIQEYVAPTPSPTPAPTPTPIQWNFERARCVCELCGEEYYYDEGHECETDPWEEFGETMEDGFEYVKESFEKEKCVPTGTMITLADGTQKPVESVTESDLLLVYDHEAGAFTTATINFIERNDAALSTVVTLAFSDGSDTALVYEHGYFDLNEMRYVFLTAENAEDYIGHRFYKAEIVDGVYTPVEATLTAVTVTEEVVASYDFPTKYYLNFFADGLLSMPAETAGLTNFFAYDDDLAYNTESMTAAIEQYGLLEYADLAAWLTEDEFVSYPAQYLAVNYGNGTLTQETLIELIETYVHEYR